MKCRDRILRKIRVLKGSAEYGIPDHANFLQPPDNQAHLNIDSNALRFYYSGVVNPELLKTKHLRELGAPLWPAKSSELISAPPIRWSQLWRAASPKLSLMKRAGAPRLQSSHSPRPASAWSDRWPS